MTYLSVSTQAVSFLIVCYCMSDCIICNVCCLTELCMTMPCLAVSFSWVCPFHLFLSDCVFLLYSVWYPFVLCPVWLSSV
jgi:hypothetical protein